MTRKTKLKTWKQKIMEEELKLKADIRKVLDHGGELKMDDETYGRGMLEIFYQESYSFAVKTLSNIFLS